MTEDLLGYNEMVEGAMRSVVRQALDKALNEGLPGNHHFYITFRTEHPEVNIPDYLVERYPDEMTIVLQHQFWNLETREDGFSVELSFNSKMERLDIPFSSLITFADPSVNFGLQFHVEMLDDEDLDLLEGLDDGEPPLINNDIHEEAKAEDFEDLDELDEAEEEPKDNVVTLDHFRKKN